VQHVSGQGQIYDLIDTQADNYYVKDTVGRCWVLPKPEYCICAPPEQWVDVTKWFEAKDLEFAKHIGSGYRIIKKNEGFYVEGKEN